MNLSALRGKSVAVWGLGREGRVAVERLHEVGAARVLVVDDKLAGTEPSVLSWADAAAELPSFDVLVKSPGVSAHDPRVRRLVDAGVTVTGGTALWLADHAAQVIGVTGSKGKSTTSSLIAALLRALGEDVYLGGNIGEPLLAAPPAQRYVAELSSYQLTGLQIAPAISVVTALFPDHVDWHGSVEQYYDDKLGFLRFGDGPVVYQAADPTVVAEVTRRTDPGRLVAANGPRGFRLDDTGAVVRDDLVVVAPDELRLRGEHNLRNVCVALTAVQVAGWDVAAHLPVISAALREFAPLAHRLSEIADPSGLVFVDDSLSTNPNAAIAALRAYPTGPVALIVGGFDRGVDYSALYDELAAQTRPVLLLGLPLSGETIVARASGIDGVDARTVTDLHDAVRTARATLSTGAVLMSPAAPSFGQFRDYADRSAHFVAAIDATR